MRVLGGEFRGTPLRAVDGWEVRPSARRTRETLFEFLAAGVPGARFLDLCAGSGAVGVEALSRGALFVRFVDRAPESCRVIAANVEACGADARRRSEVLAAEVVGFLREAAVGVGAPWDIAFFDPPYRMDYGPALELFATGAVLRRKGGVLVVEHHAAKALGDRLGALRRWRVVRQGDSCLSFFEQRYSVPRNKPS